MCCRDLCRLANDSSFLTHSCLEASESMMWKCDKQRHRLGRARAIVESQCGAANGGPPYDHNELQVIKRSWYHPSKRRQRCSSAVAAASSPLSLVRIRPQYPVSPAPSCRCIIPERSPPRLVPTRKSLGKLVCLDHAYETFACTPGHSMQHKCRSIRLSRKVWQAYQWEPYQDV